MHHCIQVNDSIISRFSSEQCIDNCPVILRDEEPASCLAFTLSSKDYQQQMEAAEGKLSQEKDTELTDFNETNEARFERILKSKSSGYHINYGM